MRSNTRAVLWTVGAVAVGAVLWLLWRQSTGRAPLRIGSCRECNVLLITIDTLRADRVGAFGGGRNLTPNLDALARDGLILTRAYASAPLTLPSHTSILTGVSPPTHGVRANGLFRLGPNLPTLATILKESGYRTGAFVGAFVLDARFGLTRGFDVYDDKYGEKHEGDVSEGAERRAEDVIEPAFAWINQQSTISNQHWFAWVHLYDPHEPYRAPQPWASQHEPYDAEVAYTDAMVGRFVEQLRGAGQLQHTLIVVAADHGESLGEHGERTHGAFVYDATMRVPWIIWASDGAVTGTYDGLVRLIDLAPTTLDIVQRPKAQFEGRSLTTILTSPDTPPAYLEAMEANLTRGWAPLTAIVANGRKFIDLPIPELYDLRSDPAEATNLFTKAPADARTLESLLRDARTRLEAAAAGTAERTTLSADARQRLQALGYVGSSATPGQRIYTDADDPKALIGPSNELNAAVESFNAGRRDEALAAVRQLIAAHPNFSTAYGELASMQRSLGDLGGAIATLDGIAKRGLADHRTMVVLAGYLMQAGRLEDATAILEAVSAAHPDNVDAYNSLGVIAMRRGDTARARELFRKVLTLDPTSATAYANLGTADLLAHDLDLAIRDLRQAVSLDPRNYDAEYNLALALESSGRHDEARSVLDQFVRTAPPERYAREIAEFKALLAK